MFTGLIQALGQVQFIGSDRVKVSCVGNGSNLILTDLAIGDSVSVDGICLTVIEILPRGFVAAASPETLGRTTLGQSDDRFVNLETSLRVGSKLGGHFVMGHIDGIGFLQAKEQTMTSWEMSFTTTEAIARYIVPKGSIAVNGISLTIADYDDARWWFKVAVIPLTYAETNLCYLQLGDAVNLEADILGKYAAKSLYSGSSQNSLVENGNSELNTAFLAENGYI
ncbi:riboflavin synthase [Aliterella atlantica]|uniref:Riboflavin synthase n=1 Tax=Aliterella atlantica CENA595 TaxID=1618023 RepID=A0A0D8ZV67_9CYAN|nr:riboflavin synthase [Aliterella atlantica]KJH71136.1 riboflavin synthase subunit alpha [Aliterella atlantica CENA595]